MNTPIFKDILKLSRRLALTLGAIPMDAVTEHFTPLGDMVADLLSEAHAVLEITDDEMKAFNKKIADKSFFN